MIVALLNQSVGKTTLALHLAGQCARDGKRVILIDADPQGSALDWSEQRARQGWPRLFGAIGLARDTLHREAPELARDACNFRTDLVAASCSAAAPPARSSPARSSPERLPSCLPTAIRRRSPRGSANGSASLTPRAAVVWSARSTSMVRGQRIVALAAEVERIAL
jgi:hypothetical protein